MKINKKVISVAVLIAVLGALVVYKEREKATVAPVGAPVDSTVVAPVEPAVPATPDTTVTPATPGQPQL